MRSANHSAVVSATFSLPVSLVLTNMFRRRTQQRITHALAKNVATSDQERLLIDRIKQMDRFRAFYCCEGQRRPVAVRLLE